MGAHTFNLRTEEGEAVACLCVQCQSETRAGVMADRLRALGALLKDLS